MSGFLIHRLMHFYIHNHKEMHKYICGTHACHVNASGEMYFAVI